MGSYRPDNPDVGALAIARAGPGSAKPKADDRFSAACEKEVQVSQASLFFRYIFARSFEERVPKCFLVFRVRKRKGRRFVGGPARSRAFRRSSRDGLTRKARKPTIDYTIMA